MMVSLEGSSSRCARLGWWLIAGSFGMPLLVWSRGRVLYDGSYLARTSYPWLLVAGMLLLLAGFYRLLSGPHRHPRGWEVLLLRFGFLPAWWLILLGAWIWFALQDLGHTRFAVSLLLVPLVALWYTLYAACAPARRNPRTGALLFILLTGTLVAMAPVLSGHINVPLSLLLVGVGSLPLLLVLLVVRRRIAATLGSLGCTLARGVLLGFACLWFPLVIRSDNGCLGVSEAYETTLLATSLLVFGFGPGIFDLLDPALTPENHRVSGPPRSAEGRNSSIA